jgi:hypothetical protein
VSISATAKLGWIIVAGGLVLKDWWKAWVHWLGVTNDDLSRFDVMHLCGVGGSTERDQDAQDQNGTHQISPMEQALRAYVMREPQRRNF